MDFSQWLFGTQVIAFFAMVLGSLLVNSSIPLICRIIATRREFGPGVTNRPEFRALILITVLVWSIFLFFVIFMGTFFALYCALSPEVNSVFLTVSFTS